MKIEINAKNYSIKPNLKNLIEKKVGKLAKYFGDSAVAKVVCRKESDDFYKMELSVFDRSLIFRSERGSDNMYENLDVILPKVERQIIKNAKKLQEKNKKAPSFVEAEFISDEPSKDSALKVVKTKDLELVPLTEEDAIANMEMLGHAFYLYLSKETGKVHLLYLRNDGNLGEIRTNI